MTVTPATLTLSGALVMGYAVAALFFGRFWRESHDRLFGFFCAAFALLAVQRVMVVLMPDMTATYIVRLVAFVLILVAVADKNREG